MKYIFFKNLANDLGGAYHELSETGLGIKIGRLGPEHRRFVVKCSNTTLKLLADESFTS